MRKTVLFILAVTVVAFLNFYPDQVPRAQSWQQIAEGTDLVNITGKIIKEPDGYYIQGQTPPEIFRILNPVPKQLDSIVKSRRSVKIRAQIVQGDNVNIKKINW
jgi:hypothetical protein